MEKTGPNPPIPTILLAGAALGMEDMSFLGRGVRNSWFVVEK